jgi:hypothetical protein
VDARTADKNEVGLLMATGGRAGQAGAAETDDGAAGVSTGSAGS